jgi:hypothetical protein
MEKDQANQQLLAREAAINDARSLFSPQIEMLDKMVDYGTNLVMRVLSYSSTGSIVDFVIVGTLCKQIVAMLDGVAVLLRAGALLAAQPVARSLWEAGINLAWVLERDTEQRAKSLWVSRLVGELKEHEALLPNSPYRQRVAEDPEAPKHSWPPEVVLRSKIAAIERVLAEPEFKALRDAMGKKKGWSPAGGTTLRERAESLKLGNEYEVFYAIMSGVAHGEAIQGHVRISGGVAELHFIRDPRDAGQTINLVASWTIRALRAVLTKYRQEELPSFARHYVENWRAAFLSVRPPSASTKK